MKEYVVVISAVVAGFFTIIMWKLNHKTRENASKQAEMDSKFKEKKVLYVKTHELFESAMKCTKKYQNSHLSESFSQLTAEINLIASENVIHQYSYVGEALQDWISLYLVAFPPPTKMGEQSYIVMQSPDPTLKYKQPEKEAFDKFYSGYEELIKLMRTELAAV